MSDFVITACSTADLSQEHFDRIGVKCLFFTYNLDGVDYPDDLGKTMPFDEFYKKLDAGSISKTSQVNVEDYITAFTPILEEGKDILHLAFSSGLSGSYNSANIARDELLEKFPERKITVVDSLAASSGYGLFVDTIADLKAEGMGYEELCEYAEKNKLRVHHWFYSTDLSTFVRGGRISKASGLIGTVLKICPVLNVSFEGKLVSREKVRTRKKAIERVVELMEEHCENGLDYDKKVFISNAACMEDATAVADLIEQKFTKMKGKVLINSIGTVIGSHTGSGTLALFFWGDERVD